MKRMQVLSVLVLALLGVGEPVSGQLAARADEPDGPEAAAEPEPKPQSDEKERKRRLEDLTSGKTKLPARPAPGAEPGATDDPAMPVAPRPTALQGDTREKYEESLREYYDYHISGLRHRSKVFQWQLFSSRLIFVAVLLLVLAGIYFAAVQFHTGLRKPPEQVDEGEATTEFSASLEGIKVSSPVLGVVILVISLVFFYLYLVYVYPIENIF